MWLSVFAQLSLILAILFLLHLQIILVGGDEVAKISFVSESGDRSEILGEECRYGLYFRNPVSIKCVCVTGIWAFYESWCTSPELVIGGINYCMASLRLKVKLIVLLSSSNSTSTPSVTRLSANMEILKDVLLESDNKIYWNPRRSSFLTFGATEWEFIGANGESRCLRATSNGTLSYCHFSNIGPEKVTRVRTGCDYAGSINVQPDYCSDFFNSTSEEVNCKTGDLDLGTPTTLSELENSDGPETESNDTKIRIQRTSFQETIGNEELSTEKEETLENDSLSLDENPPPLAECSSIVLNHVSSQVENRIQALIANRSVIEQGQQWPVIRILKMATEILKQSCTVVSSKFLDLAFMTFVAVQIDSLHMKEPFIAPATFSRIHKALTMCYNNATPHSFVPDMENPKYSEPSPIPNLENPKYSEPPPIRDCSTRNTVSDLIEKNGETWRLSLPVDRKAVGFEPIVETVWKIVVNAHSYCYGFFWDYFNDHHSYTMALLPLFTNGIQEIWLPAPYGGNFVDPDRASYLYGGLLGDHRNLLRKVDMCVAASRVGSAYPWHMNRPLKGQTGRRKWRRKRRAPEISTFVCVKAALDFQTVLKLPRCE